MIAALTARQHGVVKRVQLLAYGVGAGAIELRLRRRRLHVIYRGVYSPVPPSDLRPQGRWMAAVLAAGDGAVLSHAAAAALWDLRRSAASAVDVTVPTHAGRARQRGIRLHRSTTLDPDQTTLHDRIPVTSVPRTIIDLADRLDRRTAERALDQAEVLRLLDLTSLDAAVKANPGRRGSAVVARPLTTYGIGEDITDSDLEDEFLRLCERFGLPAPEVQALIAGLEVDVLFREQRLVVELDSRRWHAGWMSRQKDHERDIAVQLEGFRVVRFSYRRVLHEPAAVAADLRALLRS